MDKYYMFRKILDMVSDDFDVTDADMNDYCGRIVVKGENYSQTIKIEIELDSKAEEEDTND